MKIATNSGLGVGEPCDLQLRIPIGASIQRVRHFLSLGAYNSFRWPDHINSTIEMAAAPIMSIKVLATMTRNVGAPKSSATPIFKAVLASTPMAIARSAVSSDTSASASTRLALAV